MKPTVFIEQLDLSEASFDADNRTLTNVVLIRAGQSANKRHYSEAVLQRAVSVFENAPAYLNHGKPGEKRGLQDLTGWYSNVRYEGGRLIADRRFARTPAGDTARGIAEDVVSGNAPRSLAGLSINAVGSGTPDKSGVLHVESIDYAQSVDDVIHPAAGGSYVEAAQNADALTTALIEAMSFEDWQAAQPEYVDRLKNEWKKIRQSEAVKALEESLAETQTALTEAQNREQTLTAERESVLSELTAARRELAIVEALRTVQLPTVYETDLRERLMKSEPDTWADIIQREQRKAKMGGQKPRVNVTGGGQQIAAPVEVVELSAIPRDDEDAVTYHRRISQQRKS